jgi:membrane-bound lytic murein transglycosylase
VDVPSSNDQTIALEIALLESVANLPVSRSPELPEPAVSAPKPSSQEPKTAKPKADKPVEAELQEVSEAIADEPAKITANSAELDDALWRQTIETIKEKHNTLYGIMRMAKPSWEDTTLTLAFAFAFHQNRINDAKHRDIIAKTIKNLSGQEVNVVCILDPSIKPKPPVQEAVQKPANNLAVESISNIFGGAELLES